MKNSIKIGALAMVVASAGLGLVGCGQQDATLKHMGINSGFQTEYLVGEQLNLDGAELVLTYSDGEQKTINITSDMIQDFSTTAAGEKSLKVTYEGKSIDVAYKVVESDFDSIYSNIRTNFLATKYVEALFMRNGVGTDDFTRWTNYDKYVRNDNLFYCYDYTTEGSYRLYNFELQKVYDGKTITDNNEPKDDWAYYYAYASAFLLDTSVPGNNVYEKQVKIEDHKYTLSYMMENGANNMNCKIVASFDLKIESCEAFQVNTLDGAKVLYTYTNVQTLTWPEA